MECVGSVILPDNRKVNVTTHSNSASPLLERFVSAVNRTVVFITRYWLAVTIVFFGLFAGLPVLAPVLMHFGFTAPADLIYRVYSVTCHQLAYRSYFFFGEQSAYTIAELQAALNTTHPASDPFFWREVNGNAVLGFKMAWCERDAAIYASMLFAFLLFGLLRTRVKQLDWRAYLLFVIPMAIDGVWQLVTSPLYLLPFLPQHESSAELRAITGALFGFGSVWLVFPHIDRAMRDAYQDIVEQAARKRS